MSANWNCSASLLKSYEAPEWTSQLTFVPQKKLELAQLPTPVHQWEILGLPEDITLFIKRDDLTGCALSGNKVRKLEFILAEAIERGCKHVITTGAHWSNHCRSTAVATARVGLKCHLLLMSDPEDTDERCEGNMFLNTLSGADVYFLPRSSTFDNEVWSRQKQLADKIEKETGEKSYVLPVGGSDTVGLFGYVEAFKELLDQGLLEHVTDIVFACGSGGTAAGLVVANQLATNSRLGMHGIIVTPNSKQYFYDHCDAEIQKLGLDIKSKDVLNCIEGYLIKDSPVNRDKDLEFICRVGRETGIFLDPTFTGKAARGLFQELQLNPTHFKGKKILFIHTGGIFGAMEHKALLEELRKQSSEHHHVWDETMGL